jgi:hypothetical protein
MKGSCTVPAGKGELAGLDGGLEEAFAEVLAEEGAAEDGEGRAALADGLLGREDLRLATAREEDDALGSGARGLASQVVDVLGGAGDGEVRGVGEVHGVDAAERGSHVLGSFQSKGGVPERDATRTRRPWVESRCAMRRPVLPVPPRIRVVFSRIASPWVRVLRRACGVRRCGTMPKKSRYRCIHARTGARDPEAFLG